MAILEEETKAKYGYYSWELKPQSNKRLLVQCDECSEVRIIRRKSYRAVCKSCSRKGIRHPLFCKHLTEETKRKMGEANKGKKHTEETKKRISESTKGEKNHGYGKHLSEELKKKIGKASKGRIFSEESRRKISEAEKGKKNHNWKNGASFKPYCEKFDFTLKEKIREKYNRKCYLCGKSEEENGQRLDVHHIDKDKMQGCNEKTWFLIPLCRSCHMQIHMKEKTKKGKKKN